MKKTRYFFALATLFLAFSCAKERGGYVEQTTTGNNVRYLKTPNPFYRLSKVDAFLSSDPGKYIDIYSPSDYSISLSASRSTPIDKPVYGYSQGLNHNIVVTGTRGFVPDVMPYTVTFDGANLDKSVTRAETTNDYSALFGKDVTLSLKRAATRSSETGAGNELAQGGLTASLYIPQEIEILLPAITGKDGLYPLCYYDGFVMQWNADPHNLNGIIVVVEWMGTMMFGYDHPEMYMRKTVHIADDNGTATLEASVFDDIPDTALCHLTIARGAIENKLVDDEYSVKIMAESHVSLPFILIRNICDKQ
ncbi:MAG: hypothetical protein LBH06_08705 [Rikenellaceae bacterium]|nr:hypothetical protein [Rikenellaceae bacterium]